MSLAGPNRKPALTAAASKIGYSRQVIEKLKELPWQDRAWQVYEAEGSIYFMTRYRSAVARKIDYFAAIVDSPGDDPTSDATYNDEGELVSLGSAAKVLEAEGGPELIRRLVSELMVHWDVSGEAYLVRFDVEPFWRILSIQELKKQGNTYTWGDDTYQQGSVDPDGVFRVWKPHPRFHWEADSPTKHILEDAEELILLRRELKARSQSRLPSGAWVLPDTVDFTPFGDDENGTPDDFARELTNHMSQAVKDAGSAASLVPWILTVDREDHPLVVNGYISFTRDWEVNMEQREALLRSIATGLDVPPEILTGMADLNHWSAWLVSEQAVSQHVAPTVDDILDSLTVNWFRPLLEAASVDPEGAVLWRDISPATVPPDRTGVALDLFREGVISDTAVRRVSDFDEDDAVEVVEDAPMVMDAAELLQRINAFGVLRRAGAEWDDAVKAAGLPPIAQIPGLLPITVRAEEVVKNEEAVVSAIDDLLGDDSPLPGAAVTAAVRRRILATELSDIDTELLTWVQDQADKEIARLFNLALTAADDPLDESLLVSFAARLERKIAQAQAAARKWLTRITGRTPSDVGEDLARAQGVQTIVAGTLDAARRKLFTPDGGPDPIDTGRIPTLTTPTEAIRHGLSLAGGGPAIYEDGHTAELIGNGQKVHDELAGDGFFVDGYVWKYGHPANTFEPHLRLDGTTFLSWDDPKLSVNFADSWLRRSHYAPGDHKGCCCAFIQVIVEAFQPVEGRDTSGTGGGLGFDASPLTAEAGALPGKSYAYTADPKTGQVVSRKTLKRTITGLENVPEHRREEFSKVINDALDQHSPAFRTPTIEIDVGSRLEESARYDSFGLVAGGKDKMIIHRNVFMDDDGNWRPEAPPLREVVIHENGHRTNNLANFGAPTELAEFDRLAHAEIQSLSQEMAESPYVMSDMTQMVYPVSIERRLIGGNLADETFSELSAFAFDQNLGSRYLTLRDAAQEVINATSQWLGTG